MKVVLESIGLKEIIVNNETEFEYEKQGEILHDFNVKNDEFKKCKQKFSLLKQNEIIEIIEKNEFTNTTMYEISL